MRKWLILVLVIVLLLSAAPVIAAANSEGTANGAGDDPGAAPTLAEESNEGTVYVVDDWSSEPDEASGDYELEPFIPEDMERTVFDSGDLITGTDTYVAPYSIFDNDGRVTVSNPSTYPYSAIAYIKVTGECGDTWTASGFMVGKDRLLTAAHCLVCSEHSAWAKYMDFYFGYYNDYNYRYHYGGRWTAWAGNLFKDFKYTTQNDFGCVKLYENVGDTVGWLGSHWNLSDESVESYYLYVAGYRRGILRYDAGWVTALDSTHLSYRMDTEPGNSGCPIFTSDYYAVGINIASNNSFNTGYRLTGTVKDRLDGLD